MRIETGYHLKLFREGLEKLRYYEALKKPEAAGLLGRFAVASARPVRFWSTVGKCVLTTNQQELEESRKRDAANRDKRNEHSLTIRGFYKACPDPS